MMTPPLSIWARPFLVAQVEVSVMIGGYSGRLRDWRAGGWPPGRRPVEPEGPTSPSDYRTGPGDFPSCPVRPCGARVRSLSRPERGHAVGGTPSVPTSGRYRQLERPAFHPAGSP